MQKAGGQVAALAMPKPDPPRPSLKVHDPIPVQTPSVTLTGTLLGGIQTPVEQNHALAFGFDAAATRASRPMSVVKPQKKAVSISGPAPTHLSANSR